jgi:hypothetical protein
MYIAHLHTQHMPLADQNKDKRTLCNNPSMQTQGW